MVELLAAYFQQRPDAVILLNFGSGNIPQHPVLQTTAAWRPSVA